MAVFVAGGVAAAVGVVAMLAGGGCSGNARDLDVVKITGSDTMVILAQAWVAAFTKEHPAVSLQVKGGGSGVGISALCSGKIKIATASRPMTDKEIALAIKNTDKEPRQFIVGQDALAIYVHKQNPIETISLGELAEIYGVDGKITTWKGLNVDNTACPGGEIIPVSRQNSSGTYAYFQEAVLGSDREYRQGITSQSGSADVVALVSNTPCAIAYSGMGYKDDKVKVVNVSKEKGGAGVAPAPRACWTAPIPFRGLCICTRWESQRVPCRSSFNGCCPTRAKNSSKSRDTCRCKRSRQSSRL